MFLSLIRNRRSIRKFQAKEIEKKKIELLIESLLRSPSSRSLNPWEFVVIDDETLLNKLSKSKPHGASFLKNAPLGIVVCADDSIDTWIEDSSIAATYLQLAAESLELKSCWIQIRGRQNSDELSARQYISEIIGLPDRLNIEAIIGIGYPEEFKPPHQAEDLQRDKVRHNHYSKHFHQP